MRYGAKEITIHGRTLTLRSPDPEEAAVLLTFLRKACGETEFLLSYSNEISYTEEDEAALIRHWCEAAEETMIAVFDGARVVGTVSLTAVGVKSKVRHRASLGITVLRELWGHGLGRRLMREAEAAARDMGFEQIELGVFSENARAIHLYESEGYAAYGRVPDAFRLRDGSRQEEILMAKPLPPRK